MQNCTCVVDADAGIAAEDMGVDAYDYEDLDYWSWNWNGSECSYPTPAHTNARGR